MLEDVNQCVNVCAHVSLCDKLSSLVKEVFLVHDRLWIHPNLSDQDNVLTIDDWINELCIAISQPGYLKVIWECWVSYGDI